MKYTIIIMWILMLFISSVSADFMFEETDPYCSLTGTTHTSFPWEISDTSSWYIPTVYQWKCDQVLELSDVQKQRIFIVMDNFFEKNNYYGPIYWEGAGQEWINTLNPEWQKFINNMLFPKMIDIVNSERLKQDPNEYIIATINYIAKIIGYDYFISMPRD